MLDLIKDKIKSTNLNKYGVENPMFNDDIKDKLKQTCIDKYGVDNASKSKEVKEKIVNVIQEKYGVKNIMELEKYQQKISETLSKNNSISTSKQQLYLHKLFGGVLNYASNYFVLDIAFPEENIYIEYNGGGHDLSVKLGSLTEEKFKQKELKRYHCLKDYGWKAVFIDSSNDMLPNDNTLQEILDIAKSYLFQGGKYIKFDITNKIIIKDRIKENFTYGKLRRIKEEDLEENN